MRPRPLPDCETMVSGKGMAGRETRGAKVRTGYQHSHFFFIHSFSKTDSLGSRWNYMPGPGFPSQYRKGLEAGIGCKY